MHVTKNKQDTCLVFGAHVSRSHHSVLNEVLYQLMVFELSNYIKGDLLHDFITHGFFLKKGETLKLDSKQHFKGSILGQLSCHSNV